MGLEVFHGIIIYYFFYIQVIWMTWRKWMVKQSNFVIEILEYRVPVEDNENEMIVSDEELLNSTEEEIVEEEEKEEKENVKSKQEKKEKKEKSEKKEKEKPKQEKKKMSAEELKKLLEENSCIEDQANGLYRCTLCKRNINSKTQIITHLNSSL